MWASVAPRLTRQTSVIGRGAPISTVSRAAADLVGTDGPSATGRGRRYTPPCRPSFGGRETSMLVERTGLLFFSEPQMHDVRRQFSTEKGPDDEGDSARSSQAVEDTSSSGSSQHDAWVQFQQSIAVSGFETGQITKEKDLTKTKTRGGKLNRKRAEKEAEFEAFKRGDQIQLKGGEFPTQRYSDEETERLLAEAYAYIPPRAGKRGTNHLRREKRRWHLKRQYDAKKKHERYDHHLARMKKRHEISVQVYETRTNAPEVCRKDREYQERVLDMWAVMNGHAQPEQGSKESAAA